MTEVLMNINPALDAGPQMQQFIDGNPNITQFRIPAGDFIYTIPTRIRRPLTIRGAGAGEVSWDNTVGVEGTNFFFNPHRNTDIGQFPNNLCVPGTATPLLNHSGRIHEYGTLFVYEPHPSNGSTPRGSQLSDMSIFQVDGFLRLPEMTDAVFAQRVHHYDFGIRVIDTLGTIEIDNIHFPLAACGIVIKLAGRPNIGRISGEFLQTGVQLMDIQDIGRIEEIHAWCYQGESQTDERVLRRLRHAAQNARILYMYRVDGLTIDKLFAFNSESALVFDGAMGTGATAITVQQLYADFCKHGILMWANDVRCHVNHMIYHGLRFPQQDIGIEGAWAVVTGPVGSASGGTLTFDRVDLHHVPNGFIFNNGSANHVSVTGALDVVHQNLSGGNHGFVWNHSGDSRITLPAGGPRFRHGSGSNPIKSGNCPANVVRYLSFTNV